MKCLLKFFAFAIALISVSTLSAQTSATIVEDVTVVQLSQIPGEYETKQLNLAPGRYIFEVTNKNVDKKLGFWLTP